MWFCFWFKIMWKSFVQFLIFFLVRYWRQRADERLGNRPQDNQEPLVVKDAVGRLPDELGVSKSME